MTAYTKSTNFATKDTLTSGDPLKIIKGTEINTEFDNIATAVNSKSDTASPTFTGTVTIPTLSVSGTAAITGVATLTANPVLSAGTANGVTYLNGSKSLTSGSTFVFDGTNVGIGTSSPAYKLNTYASTTSLSIQQVIQNNNAGAGTAALGFSVSSIGGGEGLNVKGGIGFQRSAAYGGGFMAFYNNNSGAAGDFTTADEKMRIDSSGNVTVANGTIQTTATADATVGFQLIKVSATVTAGTNKYIQFLTNNGAASTGFIASNGASNAGFFAGSDRRIKTDIHAVSDGVKKVMQLKPSKFKFKENDEQSYGFIAQELNEVFPECVYKPNDGKGDELAQGQEPWAVNLDKLIPYLTAAIQEQQALITALTARIEALENK